MARPVSARADARPDGMTDSQGPLFSVVLLISGQAPHLDEAVRSASAQAVDEVEIIAIDDSASDRVHDVVDQLARQSRVPMYVVRTAGIGRPQLWNAGAQAAGGRYLAFLDANDEYHPERLDAFRRAHSICRGFAWGFSGVEAMDERGRPVAVEVIRDRVLRSTIYVSRRPIEAIRNLPHMFTPVGCGNLVVDARTFHAIGGFRDYPHLSSWDLALRLFRASEPVTIERPLYRYRIRPAEASPGEDPSPAAGLVAREQTAITEEYWRGLVQDGFVDAPVRSSAVRPAISLDPDARAAMAAALWGVDRLRRVPFLYGAVRRMARTVRRVERRVR